jgi:hypothetical protein
VTGVDSIPYLSAFAASTSSTQDSSTSTRMR